MSSNFQLWKREGDQTSQSEKLMDIFPEKEGFQEKWLFIAPHDDDVVIGAGLLLQKALEEGVQISVLLTTDGSMGYCQAGHRETIAQIRREETLESFRQLDISDVEWLNFPDCNLHQFTGRRPAKEGDPCVIEGCTGMQNAYTHYLRKVKPTKVFLAAGSDLHPDHKTVYEEAQISLFHASGDVWPELGEQLPFLPDVYEMAIYCDFDEAPNIKLQATEKELEKKLEGILAYQSQTQIEQLVNTIRNSGPVEYFRDLKFNLYDPNNYKDLF